jgi:hypothetical protein
MDGMRYAWIVLNVVAMLVPLTIREEVVAEVPARFDAWPAIFDGRPLARLELTVREERFGRDFPGHIARFTNGSREIVVRWLRKETRKLHPIADCLKGEGYKVKSLPVRIDASGRQWGCVRAARDGKSLEFCEIVYDGSGNSWSDVSSWYWAAVLGRTNGPWWAMSVAGEAES